MDEQNDGFVLTEETEKEKTVSDSASDIIDKTTENETEQKRINKKTLMFTIAGILIVIVAFFCYVSFFGGVSPEEESTEAETGEYSTDLQGNAVEQKSASLFSNGLVSVLKDGKWGYMNEAGEIVIDYQFETANPFNENGIASVSIDGIYGLIDKTGKYVVNPQFDFVSASFDEGYSIVKKGEKYGFIDMSGKIVIDCYYDSVTSFRNGYSVVLFGDVFGVIDTSGKYIINPQYKYLNYAFSKDSGKNIFIAEKDQKYGYIDITGKTVIEFQFDNVMWYEDSVEFIEDKYAVVHINDKYGVIDTNGKYLINAIYDSLDYCCNGIFIFTDYDTYKEGFVTIDGVESVAAQFDEVGGESDGLILVKLGDYYGFVDYSGTYIINPVFDEANGFHNGYSVVKKGDKYTFINTKGELVVDYQFDEMTDFNTKGYSIVKLNDRYGVINNKGEYILNCQYRYATKQNHYVSYTPLYDDYFCVIDDEKISKVITADGNIVAQGFDGIAGNSFDVCDIDGCYELVEDCSDSKYCYKHTFNEIKWFAQSIENKYNYWNINISDDDLKLTISCNCSIDDYSALRNEIEAELGQISQECSNYFYYYLENQNSEVLINEERHLRQQYVINENFDLIYDFKFTENENMYNFVFYLEAIRK